MICYHGMTCSARNHLKFNDLALGTSTLELVARRADAQIAVAAGLGSCCLGLIAHCIAMWALELAASAFAPDCQARAYALQLLSIFF